MVDVTVTGADALEALRRRLGDAMPKQARQAVSMGVREAVQRTQRKGLSIAKKRYAFSSYGKAKVDGILASKSVGADKMFGEVRFKGEIGVPFRWFQTKPGRPKEGKKIQRTADTLRVRIIRGGPMKQLYGAGGEKVFWWRHPKTKKLLLMYRLGRQLKVPERMGAAPIQAIQKQENYETIGEYLQETMLKRVNHQLSRIGM